MDPQVNF